MATPAPLAPFLKAASSGSTAEVESLLDSLGLPAAQALEDPADGKNALHLSALEGHLATVQLLLARSFPVDARTRKGLTPFHYAVFKGHLALARCLAGQGADVGAVDGQERSALHLACTAGSLPTLQYLHEELRQSPLDCAPSSDGMTCAHFAALAGNVETLEWLGGLQGGEGAALLTARNASAVQPLHLAVMKGHTGAAQWLLEQAGADVNSEEGKGRTPLHLATSASSAPLVAYLLHAGADPRRVDKAGDTPEKLARSMVASRACPQGLPAAEKVRDLLASALAPPSAPPSAPSLLSADDAAELGADALLPPPGYGRAGDRVYVRWAQAEGGPGCPCTEYGLQWAPRGGMLSLSQAWKDAALAEGGSSSSSSAATAHTFACLTALPPATHINLRVRARNSNGWGPWSHKSEDLLTAEAAASAPAGAAAAGAAAVPSANVAAGEGEASSPSAASAASAPPTAPPAPAGPPLDVALIDAVLAGDTEALVQLTQPPASLAALAGLDTANSRTLVHHAASSGQLGSLVWLLSQEGGGLPGSVLEARDSLGATPMLLAVAAGSLALVKAVAARGGSLNTPDAKGFTPLHYAALKARPNIFRWLLEAGAEPSVRAMDGKSVRATVEGLASGSTAAAAPGAAAAAAAPTATQCDELRSYLGNAECLPLAPPPPTFLMATASSITLALPIPKWAPGSPHPVGFELQVANRSGFAAALTLAWSTAIEVAPTGVNICAPNYCAGAAAGAGAAPPPASDPLIPSQLPFTPACVVVSGLQPATNYAFQLRAFGAKGAGVWSARTADLATLAAGDKTGLAPELAAAATATASAASALVAALKPPKAASGAAGAGAGAAASSAAATPSAPLHSTAYLCASLAALRHLRPPLQAMLAALRGEKFVPAPQSSAPAFGSPAKPPSAEAAASAAAASAQPAADGSLLGCCLAGDVSGLTGHLGRMGWRGACEQGALQAGVLGGSAALLGALLAACASAGASAEELRSAVEAFPPPAQEQAGWGPLHYAASAAPLAALAACPLVAAGGLLQAWAGRADEQGVTPCHLAAHSNHSELLHELGLLAPQALWEKDRGGLAPIHYAAAGNAAAAVAYLLWGAKAAGVAAARAQDALRRSPREVAQEAGAREAMKVLDGWEALRERA